MQGRFLRSSFTPGHRCISAPRKYLKRKAPQRRSRIGDSPPPQPTLIHGPSPSSAQRYRADLRRHTAAHRRGAIRLSRRARVAGRAQRIRQIDPVEDRGRPGRTGPRLGLRAARSRGALFAARAGFLRLRVDPRICRGRAAAGRWPPCRPFDTGATRPHRRRRPGSTVRRRGAPRRAGARAGALA